MDHAARVGVGEGSEDGEQDGAKLVPLQAGDVVKQRAVTRELHHQVRAARHQPVQRGALSGLADQAAVEHHHHAGMMQACGGAHLIVKGL